MRTGTPRPPRDRASGVDAVTFTVFGPPRTKKTSNRVFRVKGRTVVMPSAANVAWTDAAVLQLRSAFRKWSAPSSSCIPISQPVNVCALIYRDANRGDAVGYYQAIADALQGAGVVENDVLCVSWDGSRMLKDAKNPRVEITLSPLGDE